MKDGLHSSSRRAPFDVAQAYDRLVDAIARRKSEKPLVVLFGECHDVPEYTLLNMLLLQHVRARYERVAFGYEGPGDLVERMLRPVLPEQVASQVAALDTDGVHAMIIAQMILHNDAWLFDLCQTQRVSTIFNDAAIDYDTQILKMDAEVRHMAGKLGVTDERIGVFSNAGFRIRNRIMADRALAYIARNDTQVFVQQCGAAHAFFNRGINGQYFEDGLYALFKAAGCDVVTACLDLDEGCHADVTLGGASTLDADKAPIGAIESLASAMGLPPLMTIEQMRERHAAAYKDMMENKIPAQVAMLRGGLAPV